MYIELCLIRFVRDSKMVLYVLWSLVREFPLNHTSWLLLQIQPLPLSSSCQKKTQRDFCIATTSFWYLNSLPSSSWYLNRSSILHSPMPSPHVSQALAVYTKGTKAWFPDEQEGWVSATLQTSDVNDTNVKLVFVNDDDANRVIWALSCISKYIRLIDAGFLFFRNMFLQVPWQISRKPKGTICHPWGILQRWSVQKTWLT